LRCGKNDVGFQGAICPTHQASQPILFKELEDLCQFFSLTIGIIAELNDLSNNNTAAY
jgi:hypothetical protein